jgi:phage shock protein C
VKIKGGLTMHRRLYKSSANRVISGVCGGLGEYFNLDPTLIRIGWVLLILFGGSGIILYIIAACIIPVMPRGYTGEHDTREDDNPYRN